MDWTAREKGSGTRSIDIMTFSSLVVLFKVLHRLTTSYCLLDRIRRCDSLRNHKRTWVVVNGEECDLFVLLILFDFFHFLCTLVFFLITCKERRPPSCERTERSRRRVSVSRVTTPFTSTCGLGLPPCSLTMDTTPTALFDSYELDFKHIIRSISDKLEGNGKNQLGGICAVTTTCTYNKLTRVWQEQRKAALRKVELELDEADDIVHIPPFCQCATKSHPFFPSRYLN